MAAGEGPATRPRHPPDADHAIGEMSAHKHPAAPLPPSGSVLIVLCDQAHPKTASAVSTRECVPGPSKPPPKEADFTGHFTSYKHRTFHELATQGKAGHDVGTQSA